MDCASGDDSALQQPFRDGAVEPGGGAIAGDFRLSDDGDAWRRQVAASLERYRARRKPRAPRYPSLFLPFDSEIRTRPIATDPILVVTAAAQAQANMALENEEEIPGAAPVGDLAPAIIESLEPAGNVIAFPRSAAIPVFHAPELAEPILDQPRIVEAPEIVPPPPALGGILIEPPGSRDSEPKTRVEMALSPATVGQRLVAGVVDGLVLGAGLTVFAVIFLRFNPERGPLPLLMLATFAVGLLLWTAYEFLFVVYTGSTPGLRVLKLRLARFDGSPVSRRTRRWRVLASFLSAFSLGLGYFWSILDEDGLCWHDRITRTCVRALNPPQ